jgi:hypothetical protein
MDTRDEIPVEDHRYFQARLDHLEKQHKAALLNHLEQGTLTEHLREVAGRAMQAKAKLVFEKNFPEDMADDLVMIQVVADPAERSRLRDKVKRARLRMLLNCYKATLPNLTRTYQSQSETTE